MTLNSNNYYYYYYVLSLTFNRTVQINWIDFSVLSCILGISKVPVLYIFLSDFLCPSKPSLMKFLAGKKHCPPKYLCISEVIPWTISSGHTNDLGFTLLNRKIME